MDFVLRSYSVNVAEFCRASGIDRTTLYAWRRELTDAALRAWRGRRVGRPSTHDQDTVASLREALRQLSERHRDLEMRARDWQTLAADAQSCGLSRLLLPGAHLLSSNGRKRGGQRP